MPFKDPARTKAYNKAYYKYRRKHIRYRGCYKEGHLTYLYEAISDLLDTKGRYTRDRLGQKVVRAVITAMTTALQRGESVKVAGFGTLWVKTCPPRKQYQASSAHLQDTFIADLPERKRVMFRPCASLRKLVNENPNEC